MKTLCVILLRAAFPIAAALLFTGCVGAIPRPVSATKVEQGHRLKSTDVAFIQSGVTTRVQVIEQLGTNYTALPQQRAIAYSWEMKGGGWVWWWFVACQYGAAGDSGCTAGGWRAFKSPSTRTSLHEHMYAWEKTLPSSTVMASNP